MTTGAEEARVPGPRKRVLTALGIFVVGTGVVLAGLASAADHSSGLQLATLLAVPVASLVYGVPVSRIMTRGADDGRPAGLGAGLVSLAGMVVLIVLAETDRFGPVGIAAIGGVLLGIAVAVLLDVRRTRRTAVGSPA